MRANGPSEAETPFARGKWRALEVERDLAGETGGAGDPEKQRVLYPVAASAVASVLTGTALVATRFVVAEADGLTIATLRYVVAAACLVPLLPTFHRFDIAWRDVVSIAALGILYFGVFPWCISAAMQYTTASEGAIVLASTPAMTLLMGKLKGTETWSTYKGIGVAFAILGAAVASGGAEASLGLGAWRGNALMLLAAACGAIYAVFSKPLLAKYSPLSITALAMAAGAVALSITWAAWHVGGDAPRIDGPGWTAIFYIGVAGGALSFFLYAWSLDRSAPTSTMILLPLNPIAALVVGALWLGEPLRLSLFTGLALVIIGVVLVVGPFKLEATKPRRP
jgi:drug/metabolite transporter (DMT)-like permease